MVNNWRTLSEQVVAVERTSGKTGIVPLIYPPEINIGVGRGGGGPGGGQAPPIIWEGGPTYPLAPPNNSPTFSFNFYVKQEKITNVPSRRVK